MDYSKQLSEAVTYFRNTRLKQDNKQGSSSGVKDTGNGKRKTTVGPGLALRIMGHGEKICMIQFIKAQQCIEW